MSTKATPAHGHPGATAPDPAAVLALVINNVPLPPATSAALRLVCHATKLAVDQHVTKLSISLTGAENLPANGYPLTSGLTSLQIRKQGNLRLKNGSGLIVHNCNTLQTLHIEAPLNSAAFIALGATTYPSLHSLSIGEIVMEDGVHAILESFLHSCPDLRHLVLNVDDFRHTPFHIDFLAAPLPNLEYLELSLTNFYNSLAPMVDTVKPHLHTLVLNHPDGDLAPVMTAAAALPALETLILDYANFFDSSTLDGVVLIALNTVRNLSLRGYWWYGPEEYDEEVEEGAEVAAVGSVAAVLRTLPVLESLEIKVCHLNAHAFVGVGRDIGRIPGPLGMQALLSAGALPTLRRLTTDGWWDDTDGSIYVLIDNAAKVPNLEEIRLKNGFIGSNGFEALAAAGREGRWPNLRVFQIRAFQNVIFGRSKAACRALLQEAWPNLTIIVGATPALEV